MTAAGVLAAVLVVSAVCGGLRSPMDVGEPANFTDEGMTQRSGYQGVEPKIEMEKRGEVWVAVVFQGWQSSAGGAISVERAIHVGTGVRVRARFTMPTPDAGAPGVPTSAAHAIGFAWGLPDAVYLYDQDDRKRAEWVKS